MSGVRRSNRSAAGTMDHCIPVGRNRHPFVQGEAAADPAEWKTAEPPDGGASRAGREGGGVSGRVGFLSATDVLSLQVGLSVFPICNTANFPTKTGMPMYAYRTRLSLTSRSQVQVQGGAWKQRHRQQTSRE